MVKKRAKRVVRRGCGHLVVTCCRKGGHAQHHVPRTTLPPRRCRFGSPLSTQTQRSPATETRFAAGSSSPTMMSERERKKSVWMVHSRVVASVASGLKARCAAIPSPTFSGAPPYHPLYLCRSQKARVTSKAGAGGAGHSPCEPRAKALNARVLALDIGGVIPNRPRAVDAGVGQHSTVPAVAAAAGARDARCGRGAAHTGVRGGCRAGSARSGPSGAVLSRTAQGLQNATNACVEEGKEERGWRERGQEGPGHDGTQAA